MYRLHQLKWLRHTSPVLSSRLDSQR